MAQMGSNKYEKVYLQRNDARSIEAHTLALHSGGIAIGVPNDRNNLTLAVRELEGLIVARSSNCTASAGKPFCAARLWNRLKLAAGL